MDFSSLSQRISSQRHIEAFRKTFQKTPAEKILVVAHRGGPAMGTHENTMAAFEKAIDCGADMIETDVRRTRDGVLVCHHDPDVNGTPLTELSYFEANRMAEANGYTIPYLKDLVSLAATRIKLDIELKNVGYELEIVDTIRGLLEYSEFVMKSFHDSTVYAIKEVDPRITTGLLVEKHPFSHRGLDTMAQLSYEARLALTKADFLGAETTLVNAALVARMRLLKKKIFVWTANGDSEMQRLIDLGVDALITDEPDRALKLLGRIPFSK
jgi:glycerophosphoryl diester phosphodiesterase